MLQKPVKALAEWAVWPDDDLTFTCYEMSGISHLQRIDFKYQLVPVNNMTNTWSKS